jgi:hypothetical protein
VEAGVSEGIEVLTELFRLGPWAVIVGVVVWLVRSRELLPFRRLLAASWSDRLLKARGVEDGRRHDVLVAAALKAQDLTVDDVEAPPASADEPSPGDEPPTLTAVPPA